MKGITVEIVASSWIEALGGLSRWVTLSVPPAFCAETGTALAATKSAAIEAAMKPRILFPPILLGRHAITSKPHGVESDHENAWFAGRNGRGAGDSARGAGVPHETDPHRGAVRPGNRHRHRGAHRGCGALQQDRSAGGDREQGGRRGP